MRRAAAGVAAALASGLLLGVRTWSRIRRAGQAQARGDPGMIVVLGAALEPDGRPCPELAQRLDEGARLFKAGSAPSILCCGGRGSDGRSEASAMRTYLVQRGMPESAVLTDDEGPTTRRAISAARRHRRDGGRLVFVSSRYHMHRVLSEAARQSLDAEGHACTPPGGPAGPGSRVWTLVQTLREVLAVWWYALPLPDRDRLIRSRIPPPDPQRLMASAATKWPVSIRVGQRSSASKRSTRRR